VWIGYAAEEEEEEPYFRNGCKYALFAVPVSLFACTPPTVPVSRSFGLRSSYEIDILDTD
jgi:hypothetical protein